LDDLRQGVAFIHQVIAGGGKVYIHCGGGIGRAPTMAAAYFISQGLKFDEAVELIVKARPFINMTPAQMEQLKRFEAIQRAPPADFK
jgi:protein-tyrosine phosphatase